MGLFTIFAVDTFRIILRRIIGSLEIVIIEVTGTRNMGVGGKPHISSNLHNTYKKIGERLKTLFHIVEVVL